MKCTCRDFETEAPYLRLMQERARMKYWVKGFVYCPYCGRKLMVEKIDEQHAHSETMFTK